LPGGVHHGARFSLGNKHFSNKELNLNPSSISRRHLTRFMILASAYLAISGHVQAHGLQANETDRVVTEIPAALSALKDAGPAPEGMTDLKFREFFRLPVGPRGLEPTEKLISLAGKGVRIVGFMAHHETPMADTFILSPVPVTLGDEDESLADDLPVSVIFVHSAQSEGRTFPFYPGLLRLTGTLSVGAQEEADGHVSTVRLQLDPELARQMLTGQPQK
jgi:hypothetical protein